VHQVVAAVGCQLQHQKPWRLFVPRETTQPAAAVAVARRALPVHLEEDIGKGGQGAAAPRRLTLKVLALARMVHQERTQAGRRQPLQGEQALDHHAGRVLILTRQERPQGVDHHQVWTAPLGIEGHCPFSCMEPFTLEVARRPFFSSCGLSARKLCSCTFFEIDGTTCDLMTCKLSFHDFTSFHGLSFT
jgi:hypothetical protein